MYTDFTEMNVWKLASDISVEIFQLTESLILRKEDYGLTSQIRRSSNGIGANVAEAFGRTTSADKCKFYNYARGSAFETKNHLIYGNQVGYFKIEAVNLLSERISSAIHELNKVKSSITNHA
jgi:four helix bundle protein